MAIGNTTYAKVKENTDGPMVIGTTENTTKVNLTVTANTVASKATVTLAILRTVIFTARVSLLLERQIVPEINTKVISTRENSTEMELMFTPTGTNLRVVFDSVKRTDVEFYTHMMEKRFLDVGETIN